MEETNQKIIFEKCKDDLIALHKKQASFKNELSELIRKYEDNNNLLQHIIVSLHSLTGNFSSQEENTEVFQNDIEDLNENLNENPELFEEKTESTTVNNSSPLIIQKMCEENRVIPEDSNNQFEMNFGMVWLSRIGIVLLLFGLTLGLSYTYQSVGPVLKLIIGLIATSGMFFGGEKLINKMPVLGKVFRGGALATGYMTIFAAFFIPGTQVMNSFWLGITSLVIYCLSMLKIGLKWNSQTIVLLSSGFAYFTTNYTQEVFPIFWTTLAITAVIIFLGHLKKEWKWIYPFSMLGSLMSYGHLYSIPNSAFLVNKESILAAYLVINCLGIHISSLYNLISNKSSTIYPLILHANTWIFYILMGIVGHPVLSKNPGFLELIISTTHLITYIVISKINEENIKQPLLTTTLWTYGILFLGLSTLQYFGSYTISIILSVQALALGVFYKTGHQPAVNKILSIAFWILSIIASLWMDTSYPILSYGWLAIVTLIIDHFILSSTSRSLSFIFLFVSGCFALQGLEGSIPREWMTLSTILFGCLLLGVGVFKNIKQYRLFSLVWLAAISGSYIVSDVFTLSMPYRIASFIILGLVLLGGSYGYHRMEHMLKNTSK